jgi:anti-sigma factor RsiW
VSDHVGDDAELYPLGLLDDDETRALERHILECTVCAERVAQAQLVSVSLAAALPSVVPSPDLGRRLHESLAAPGALRRATRPFPLARLALAAAFVLAFVGLGWQTLTLRTHLAADDLALVTIVHSHFNHVSMTPQSLDPVAAKVLFARDGSWIYVIADKPGGPLRAVGLSSAGTRDFGSLIESGESAALLVHPTERILSLTLERAGVPVATAALAY